MNLNRNYSASASTNIFSPHYKEEFFKSIWRKYIACFGKVGKHMNNSGVFAKLRKVTSDSIMYSLSVGLFVFSMKQLG
jgi:hypothetical protein